eukprot:c33472_g1_i1 orf=138-1253(+)
MAAKEAVVTYGRRKRRPPSSDTDDHEFVLQQRKEQSPPLTLNSTRRENYKQYFLDFGQLDFSYSTCKICGLLYARGHSDDEKLHTLFHKRYLRGVSFKGWQKERLVLKHEKDDKRILLVLHSDPLQHQLKVKELVKIMEKELETEPGWLLHDRCKVYLYISLKKVVGCAVTESISQAYPILRETAAMPETKVSIKSFDSQIPTNGVNSQPCHAIDGLSSVTDSCQLVDFHGKSKALENCHSFREEASPEWQQDNVYERASNHGAKVLLFGDIKFQRERVQRCRVKKASATTEWPTVCTKLPVAAVCGVRGLWVSKTERRRGIATELMDAVRTSFIYGLVLDASQCAFSQPTPEGKAFAAKYCRTDQYLVYC